MSGIGDCRAASRYWGNSRHRHIWPPAATCRRWASRSAATQLSSSTPARWTTPSFRNRSAIGSSTEGTGLLSMTNLLVAEGADGVRKRLGEQEPGIPVRGDLCAPVHVGRESGGVRHVLP